MEGTLLNVHQPGLRRGAERLPFAPHKRYFYVEHPEEGWRVYLRACCFIHEVGNPDPRRFLVVKRFGAKANTKSWEPPKGQMEGKDGLAHPDWSILDLLTENVHREVEEEAKITEFSKLSYTGLVLQSAEKDYPDNHFFQYHIFTAQVSPQTIQNALNEFVWLNEHPLAFARLRKDKREKDALAWYDPHTTQLMGKWSPSLVILYLQNMLPQ
jgi:8-oxo-dGTP pyrophosphatase MutT (NUDIX family)